MSVENETLAYVVSKKLIGPIKPVGESNTDEKRLENFNKTKELVFSLLCDIRDCVTYSKYNEYSMKLIGDEARRFLKSITNEFEVD